MDKIVKGYPNWDIPLNANIDEYNETMGNAELLTEDKTVKGAINEIKTGNDETIGKIRDDTQINTADISNLKTSVAQNTSSLNESTNSKDITLVNGWIEYDNAYSHPKCVKIGKMIMGGGMIKSGTSDNIGYMPEGYHPEKTETIYMQLSDNTIVGGLIGPDGVIICTGASNKNEVVSFNFSFIAK